MSSPTKSARGREARNTNRDRSNTTGNCTRLFRGQRIRRRSHTNVERGSLEIRNRQNWLNIDQASALNYRQGQPPIPSTRVFRTSPTVTVGGTNIFRRGGTSNRGGRVSRSGLSIESHRHIGLVPNEGIGQIQERPNSESQSRGVFRVSVIDPIGPGVLGRASLIPVTSPWDKAGIIRTTERKTLLPTPKYEFNVSGEPFPAFPDPNMSKIQRGSQNLINLDAKKLAEASFGWFEPTNSFYNPVIPVLPRLELQKYDSAGLLRSDVKVEGKQQSKDKKPLNSNVFEDWAGGSSGSTKFSTWGKRNSDSDDDEQEKVTIDRYSSVGFGFYR